MTFIINEMDRKIGNSLALNVQTNNYKNFPYRMKGKHENDRKYEIIQMSIGWLYKKKYNSKRRKKKHFYIQIDGYKNFVDFIM